MINTKKQFPVLAPHSEFTFEPLIHSGQIIHHPTHMQFIHDNRDDGSFIFNAVLEASRKLSVLSTLYDEEELLIIGFQDFIVAVRDLLTFGENLVKTGVGVFSTDQENHNDYGSIEALQSAISVVSADLTASMRTISLDVNALSRLSETTADIQEATHKKFKKSLQRSVELSEELFFLIRRSIHVGLEALEM